MELTYRELENQTRLIELAGKLDVVGVGQVETRFAGHCSGDNLRVLVDLSAVEFMASIGIRMLMLNAKSVFKRGAEAERKRRRLPARISQPFSRLDFETIQQALNCLGSWRPCYSPNQRLRRLEPKCCFSATKATEGSIKLPVGGPARNSTSTRPTRDSPNST